MTDSRGGMLAADRAGRFRVAAQPAGVNAKDGSLLVHVPAGEFRDRDRRGRGGRLMRMNVRRHAGKSCRVTGSGCTR